MQNGGALAGAGLSPGGLSRVGRLFFEPSPSITAVAERRRARMLPKLQLAHAAQMLLSMNIVAHVEKGAVREILPRVLGVACLCVLVCYAIGRTRHVRASVWGYAGVALLLSPVSLVVSAPTSGFLPLICTMFLLPPVLLLNAFISARAALVAGLLGYVPMLVSLKAFGNPSWIEPLIAGSVAYLTFLTLIVIFGVYRDHIEADRVAELRARNQELEELRRTLDDKVTARTRELSERNAAMRLVLDNISQGIFTVSRSGAMAAEHSAALRKWFGPVEAERPFFRYLGDASASFAAQAEMAWEQLLEDVLPPELAMEQLPRFLETETNSYRLSYQRLEADLAGRILIVVSDVTAEIERERAELEKKETLVVLEHVLGDRRGFIAFMQEASELITRLGEASLERCETTRALHTLKGNAMLFGMESVAHLCHDLESSMEGGTPPEPTQLSALSERWRRLSADMEKLLGGRKDLVELTPPQFEMLRRAAHGTAPREELARLIDDLAFEPVQHRLSYFADHARRLADRFEKPVEVEVVHDGSHLDERQWPLLWAVFVHAVRNALDHGIEPPTERKAAGKSEVGHLALRARREGTAVILEIEDDGRGLDWRAIRRKCEAMNLPTGTEAELLEALFAEGMSTASEVTEISGRGVGMGALRSAVHSLGGALLIRSESGRGTIIRMVFPITSSPPQRLFIASQTAGAASVPGTVTH